MKTIFVPLEEFLEKGAQMVAGRNVYFQRTKNAPPDLLGEFESHATSSLRSWCATIQEHSQCPTR